MKHDTLTIQKHGRDYVFFYEAAPGKVYLHKSVYLWSPGADAGKPVCLEDALEDVQLFRWEVEDRINMIEDGEANSYDRVV